VEQYLTRDNILVGLIVLAVLGVLVFLLRRGKKPEAIDTSQLDPKERLRLALGKTRGGLLDSFRKLLGSGLDDDVIGSLEEILLAADIGVAMTEKLLEGLRKGYKKGELKSQEQVVDYLKGQLKEHLGGGAGQLITAPKAPTVILVCGVNGCGKTTSIAKLTLHLANQGKKVLLCASDTFRAAAVEQLNTWATRLGVEIVRGQQNADPASVAHDAHEKAVSKGFDVLIVDTAGRLHNDKNLMKELEKIARVGKKHVPDSPHEVLLVLDATTGQNAIRQAAAFTDSINVTGIVLAKLDGTAKGGMIVPIKEEMGIPVKFVGLGEQPSDLAPFDPELFVDALFS
jgi:fused signal recognition particle receptor